MSGRIWPYWPWPCATLAAVPGAGDDLETLLTHLQRTLPLGRAQAERAVDEVVAFFSEAPEAFVRRRHRELQRQGVPGTEAYERIAEELAGRPVPGPRLSARQVRRTIYG